MKKKTSNKVTISPENSIRKKRRNALDRRDLTSFLTRLVGLLLFVYVLFFVIFRIVPVKNDDMKPTIRARDIQLVYCFPNDLWNNDIVVYNADGKERTGRIVARPGDTVEITEDQTLKVNNSVISDSNIYYCTPAYDSDVEYPLQLKEDEYFVLSDYREGAVDSRQFGPVKKDELTGKVLTVIRRSGL